MHAYRFLRPAPAAALSLLLLNAVARPAHAVSDQQSLEELRNTVINLLQALVEQGVMSKDKAELLVKQAQTKAGAELAARSEQQAKQQREEEGAVRVPYVPDIVKQEISKEVAAEVRPAVTADVMQQAQAQGWGVPGALP